MRQLFLLFFVALSGVSFSQDPEKVLQAIRISESIHIDGALDENSWDLAKPATNFIQNSPYEGKAPTYQTEVKVLYDDHAIYVGAMMFDFCTDSICEELGNRDDDNLNAEKFRFLIDPYLTLQDAYEFGVFASGVQFDHRFSDWTYNAVWHSNVQVLENGWSVEMKIPYSAFRFPKAEVQKWGLQTTRDLRRIREFSQWALTPSGEANIQRYWGTLEGIRDIEPPLRLSTTPYVSGYYESAPDYNTNGNNTYSNSFSYNVGADIKFGLDERFTLDMTLLPDFSQVQSDDKVKNLSYRETTYEDYRPFFKEGTDLFNRNRLFYSRRIGKTPTHFYSISDSLQSGEYVEKNPGQAKLLNATKLSGRTNNGIGLGVLNAVTDNTWAVIRDSTENSRKILTEPLTNYNVFVIDKQMKNSSNVYLINTNVLRKGISYRNANVTGVGYRLANNKNTWATDGSFIMSQLIRGNAEGSKKDLNETGYTYFIGLRKTSGYFQFSLGHDAMTPTFDAGDLGYQSINDYSSFNGWVGLNRYKPWKFLLRSFNNFNTNYSYNYTTGLPINVYLNISGHSITKRQWGIWYGLSTKPASTFDYFESRIPGMYFRTAEWYYGNVGFSTNYQKTVAIDLSINSGNFYKGNIHGFPTEQGYGFEIEPRLRASDKLSFRGSFEYTFDPLNPGFANFDTSGNPVFGGRELNTYVSTLTSKYIFKNDLSLSLNSRHYWGTGHYRFYYSLLDNGLLKENTSYSGNDDFSYNAFYIDAIFSWQFSPGSTISIIYKNAIETNDVILPKSYSENFSSTFRSPQTNSITLKVLYYLDYQNLKRKSSNKV